MSFRPRPLALATSLLMTAVLLGACGGGTASPSPSASPAAVASPVPTPVATPVASPSATASPSAAPSAPPPSYPAGKPITAKAKVALAAYFKAVTDPKKSFHLVQKADVAVNGARAGTLDYMLDVNGIDFTADANGLGVDLKLVALGDKMWVKQGTDDWKTGPRDDAVLTDVTGVFDYITSADDLVFLDTSSRDGATIHHFSIDAPLPYQTSSMKTSGIVGSIPQMELFIADDGSPIRFTFTSVADATANGQAQHVESTSTIDVTKFGDKIVIKAPV